MLDKLKEIESRALAMIQNLDDMNALNEARVHFLGRKGEMTAVLRGLKELSGEAKAETGKWANEIKSRLETALELKAQAIQKRELEQRLLNETIDISLPGTALASGSLHPLSRITAEISEIFIGLGFAVAEGPEIERDYYNFEAMNMPPDHPAREMQDSFYVNDELLLRTHTSPVQVRTMEQMYPRLPVKVIVPGKVYRRDDDATHSPMFHQIEGLLVDQDICFGDLKGVLMSFARQFFGQDLRVRYRPSFFPFTEPSAEMDISCVNCGGRGCRVCSNTGWLEILGSGMVHPRVLQFGGYDPEAVSGFAFGMGVERIAMLKYGVPDLRLFYDNDLRFLQQF